MKNSFFYSSCFYHNRPSINSCRRGSFLSPAGFPQPNAIALSLAMRVLFFPSMNGPALLGFSVGHFVWWRGVQRCGHFHCVRGWRRVSLWQRRAPLVPQS
jgi:hypothetical protein